MGYRFFFIVFMFFDHSRVYYITPDSRRYKDCCKILFRKMLIMSINMFNSSIYSHSIVGIVLSLAIVCAAKVTSGKTCVC